MLPVNCQEKDPSLSSVGSSLGSPPHRGDRGRAGRVGSVGLGAAVGREHLSHMPPGVGGWGAPCLEAGRPQRGAGTHTQAPTVPGGNPPKPQSEGPGTHGGERGPTAQLLSAAEQCPQGLVVTLG